MDSVNINSILKNIQITFEPLAILSILISSFTALYIMRREGLFSISKERHNIIIAPIFYAIEPFLYSSVIPDNFNSILDLIQSNITLADGALLNVYCDCKNNLSVKSYNKFCIYIDKAFDKSCRNLHLRCRPIMYRISHRQFKNKKHLVFLIVGILTKYIVKALYALFISGIFSILILYAFTDLSISNNPIFLIILALALYVLWFLL